MSPADTPFGAATRFLVELAAWCLGPWAMWRAAGWLAGIVALVVLLALPAVFNAAGDKAHDGVLVPGPVRLLIEVVLAASAIAAATYLWGIPGLLGAGVLVLVAAVAGRRRAAWLVVRTDAG